MLTGFLPLWCGIALKEHAEKLVSTKYLADDRLRHHAVRRSKTVSLRFDAP